MTMEPTETLYSYTTGSARAIWRNICSMFNKITWIAKSKCSLDLQWLCFISYPQLLFSHRPQYNIILTYGLIQTTLIGCIRIWIFLKNVIVFTVGFICIFNNARNMWNESTTIKIVPVTFINDDNILMGYVLPICQR